LAPVRSCQLAALRAGTALDGYAFYYPYRVVINRNLLLIAASGGVADGGWCGYRHIGVGYAHTSEIAAVVCTASIARAIKEVEEQD